MGRPDALISGTIYRPAPTGGRVPVLGRGPLARVGLITAMVGLLASCAVPAVPLPGSAPPSAGASSSATATPTAADLPAERQAKGPWLRPR